MDEPGTQTPPATFVPTAQASGSALPTEQTLNQTPPAAPLVSSPAELPQVEPTQPAAPEPPQTSQPEPTDDPTEFSDEEPSRIPTAAQPEQSALIPGMMKPQKEETLLEWQAPSRPFKKHNRQFYTTVGVISLLIALILFFAGQMLPVAVVLAVAFLFYVINSTPPNLSLHKLTTYGIRIESQLYYWEEMGRFWFTKKFGQDLLHIEVSRFPNRVTMLLGDIKKDDMELILSEVLLHETPPPTAYEKAAKWLHEKIPIDIES